MAGTSPVAVGVLIVKVWITLEWWRQETYWCLPVGWEKWKWRVTGKLLASEDLDEWHSQVPIGDLGGAQHEFRFPYEIELPT